MGTTDISNQYSLPIAVTFSKKSLYFMSTVLGKFNETSPDGAL
jgi:hypothetical protein